MSVLGFGFPVYVMEEIFEIADKTKFLAVFWYSMKVVIRDIYKNK